MGIGALRLTGLATGLVAVFLSCNPNAGMDGEYIAVVDDNHLAYSDIEGFAVGSDSPEDSVFMLRAYVQNWIKDQLLIREAEKNMPEDFNIEKLVADYRSSLILANYLEKVIEKELDTIVTPQQINDYYQDNKHQYTLLEPILKYDYVKVSKDKKGLKDLEKSWTSMSEADIQTFCASQQCEFLQLDSKSWSPDNELLSIVPPKILSASDLKKNTSFVKSDDDFKYFVKVSDYVGKGDVPPLEFIESKIVSVILNNRKQELLKRKKQILFDKYYNTSSVNSFVEDPVTESNQ